MSSLNALLGGVFVAVFAPFARLPPLASLAVVSLLTAVVMLLVVKRTTDQAALATVKRQIHACLLEIRLFNDDLRAIVRAQGEILGHNARYLWLSLPPLVVMVVPFVLVVAQLQAHYGYRGIAPGGSALVKVVLRDGAIGAGKPRVDLEVPAGIRVETPALWIPTMSELDWRIAGETVGEYSITITYAGERTTKSFRVGDDLQRRSPLRHSGGWVDQVLYPVEKPLPSQSALASITIVYPEREVGLLGFGVHWLIAYIVLTMLFAFVLKGRFGVTL